MRPSKREVKAIANAFDKLIRWVEFAKENYNNMGQVILNVCKALGNIDVRDINQTL